MFELSKAVVYELPDPGVYNHPPRRGTIGYARCGGTIGSWSTLPQLLAGGRSDGGVTYSPIRLQP